MKIKVCGIKSGKNFNEIASLDINWIGLNFYSKSKRFVEENINFQESTIVKVGVFVNAEIEFVKEKIANYNLDFIQLHGNETKYYCQSVKSFSKVIKVFSIDEEFDFNTTSDYDFCDYFLFDTKCKEYGGSGKKFNWIKINQYKGPVPFLLAGGIGPDDVKRIHNISHPKLIGIDINSKFEIKPGLKDATKIHSFITNLKSQKSEYSKKI